MSVTSPTGPIAGAGHAPGSGTSLLADLVWLRSFTAGEQPFAEEARSDRVLTYAGLRRAAVRWRGVLTDLGVEVGGTVGLAISSPVDFASVYIATIAAGRVAAPLDPNAPDPELRTTCDRVLPALVVADRPAPPDVSCEWLALPTGSFELDDGNGAGRPSPWAPLPTGLFRERGPVPLGGLVLSTSGTTGAPKVIRLSEGQLLHTAGSVAAHHRLSTVDRGLNSLPLFHVNAEVVGLLSTLVAGATLVLDDRFHRTGFWDLARRRGVTWINAVPAVISRLTPLEPGETVPSGVRFVRSASAPLPPATLARFEEATGLPVVESYGMTEAGSQITANPLGGPRKPGSVGLPVGLELRVVAGEGLAGRVEIRGAGVVSGCGSTGLEHRVEPDGGWLDTGDLGYLDADGYLYLVGRVDDVINRGGEKIHPREVEEVLLSADPRVTAAAVVGHDRHELGQVPVAYLVLDGVVHAEDGGLAAGIVERVQTHCVQFLARPKRPVAFHVVNRLPAGATGKIRRTMIDPQSTIYSLLAG
ncbi:MAG TPA: AMP-binding protein [Acidimicrobiales bacterium]|nr:AMP-binding protein [Acidimicrobiales bacterium]